MTATEQQRDHVVPCRHATPYETLHGLHQTYNADRICDPCRHERHQPWSTAR